MAPCACTRATQQERERRKRRWSGRPGEAALAGQRKKKEGQTRGSSSFIELCAARHAAPRAPKLCMRRAFTKRVTQAQRRGVRVCAAAPSCAKRSASRWQQPLFLTGRAPPHRGDKRPRLEAALEVSHRDRSALAALAQRLGVELEGLEVDAWRAAPAHSHSHRQGGAAAAACLRLTAHRCVRPRRRARGEGGVRQERRRGKRGIGKQE